jgi:hypothetical protein
MKYFRCILSSIIAFFLCMSAFTGTATAVENNSPPIDVTTCQTNPIELTDEQQDTLNKIVSVGTHFKYVDNQLIITLNESELKNTYGFSESQYTFLQDTVLGATHADNTSFARVPASPSGAMAKCDGWYISHSDLTVGIATAVTVAAGGAGSGLDCVGDHGRRTCWNNCRHTCFCGRDSIPCESRSANHPRYSHRKGNLSHDSHSTRSQCSIEGAL